MCQHNLEIYHNLPLWPKEQLLKIGHSITNKVIKIQYYIFCEHSVLGESEMRILQKHICSLGDSLLGHKDDELFWFSNLGRPPNTPGFDLPYSREVLDWTGQIDHIYVFIWLAE